MNDNNLTTFQDLISGYKEELVELSTGKRFMIQSFMPGNLMIEIGSPLIEILTEATEDELRSMPLDIPTTNAGREWSRIEQLVCDNVTNVVFARGAQKTLFDGVVSIRRLTLVEIQELYVKIRDLSISPEELANFRKTRGAGTDESEHEELDTSDREDSKTE